MSTEHLTPQNERMELAASICNGRMNQANLEYIISNNRINGQMLMLVVECMKQYSAQQVEQQTKQLKEERDRAVDLLTRLRDIMEEFGEMLDSDLAYVDIVLFLKYLNQNNEG